MNNHTVTLVRAAAAACLLALLSAGVLLAEDDQLRLTVRRDFGYSGGGQIQGKFTLTASGPTNLTTVRFEMDGREVATADKAPFTFSFDTGSYALGKHAIIAVGQTSDGRTLRSEPLQAEFISADQMWTNTRRIMVPLLGGVLLLLALGVGGTVLFSGRNKARLEPGAPRSYGVAGGAICPKCRRPFARSFFGLNLLTGKLERCPYCGKWSVVRAASAEQLAAAEAAERAANTPTVPEASAEEQLRRQIEQSRYE